MCNGASTIAYGIVIKTWTLLIASKGFSKIKPILLALDLIVLRKRTGKLQLDGGIEGKKNFGDLPLEIIEIVKREVILNVDLLEQAETLLRDLCCEDGSVHCCDRCSGHHDEHELSQRDYRVVIQGDCDSCRENLFEFTLDLEVEMFTDILNYYGLVAPSADFITGDHHYDINKYFLIVSIPIPNSSVQSQTDHEASRSSITPLYINTSSINVAGASSRFKRLVTDWNLKLYDGPVQVMGESEGDKAEGNHDGEKKTSRKQKVEEVKIKPKWMVISHTSDCQ